MFAGGGVSLPMVDSLTLIARDSGATTQCRAATSTPATYGSRRSAEHLVHIGPRGRASAKQAEVSLLEGGGVDHRSKNPPVERHCARRAAAVHLRGEDRDCCTEGDPTLPVLVPPQKGTEACFRDERHRDTQPLVALPFAHGWLGVGAPRADQPTLQSAQGRLAGTRQHGHRLTKRRACHRNKPLHWRFCSEALPPVGCCNIRVPLATFTMNSSCPTDPSHLPLRVGIELAIRVLLLRARSAATRARARRVAGHWHLGQGWGGLGLVGI